MLVLMLMHFGMKWPSAHQNRRMTCHTVPTCLPKSAAEVAEVHLQVPQSDQPGPAGAGNRSSFTGEASIPDHAHFNKDHENAWN